jgi:hypothetical protein
MRYRWMVTAVLCAFVPLCIQPSEASQWSVDSADSASTMQLAYSDSYVTFLNGTSGSVSYFLNGDRFRLAAGEAKTHQFRLAASPLIEFDADYAEGWQSITYDLRLNQTYVFQQTGDRTLDLF